MENSNNSSKILENQEVFELIEKAREQYDTYIQLRLLDYENPNEEQYDLLRRDINHPLNIVIK